MYKISIKSIIIYFFFLSNTAIAQVTTPFSSLIPIYLSFDKNPNHEPFVKKGEITFEVDNYSKTNIYVFN